MNALIIGNMFLVMFIGKLNIPVQVIPILFYVAIYFSWSITMNIYFNFNKGWYMSIIVLLLGLLVQFSISLFFDIL